MFSFLSPYEKKLGLVHTSISDLHIDELLEIIEKDKDERLYILNVLSDFEENVDNILYRQELIKDFLENDGLYDDLKAFFKKSINIGDEYRSIKKEKLSVQKFFSTYNIDNYDTCGTLVRRYAAVIQSIIRLYFDISKYLKSYKFKSQAMNAFKDTILSKVENKSLVSLNELMDEIISLKGTYDMLVILNNRFQVIDTKIILDYEHKKEEFHLFKKKKEWETTNVDVNEKTLFEMDYFITSASVKLVDRLSALFEDFYDIFSSTAAEMTFIKFALDYTYYLNKLKLNYVFPSFNYENTEYKGLVDPYLCIKAYDESGKIIGVCANDFKKTKEEGGVLVVGENNTGKTVYTRSLGINQIFAQAGLMVTATGANIKINHQIITCYASKESHEFDGGRFETEVRALKYILDKACENTMIIVNEIFQSTAADEGTSALYNVLSYMTYINISWICVSHFLDLGKMIDNFYQDNKKIIHLMKTRHYIKDGKEYFYIDTIDKME